MKQIYAVAFVLIFSAILVTGGNKKHTSNKRQRNSQPIELRGTKEQRIAQNLKAISLGIEQIKTDEEWLTLPNNKNFVELKSTEHYVVDRGMTSVRRLRKGKKTIACPPIEKRVFVRKQVKDYVDLRARLFFLKFNKKLKITSGARILKVQVLMRTKGSCYYTPYAAKADNPLEESLHTRGIVVDISRRVVATVKGRQKEMPMSVVETKWMREHLIADKLEGVEFEIEDQEESVELETEPIEEKICYHIVVFPKQ